jgi:hypothetical protein
LYSNWKGAVNDALLAWTLPGPPAGLDIVPHHHILSSCVRRATKFGCQDLEDFLPLSASKCAEQFTLLWRKIMFAVGSRRFVVQAKQVIGCDFKFDGNPGHDIGCRIAQAFLVAMDLTDAKTKSLGKLLLSELAILPEQTEPVTP